MLDVTLNTKFVVGTNLRGDMASADWRFLLPRLSFERVLCLGVPELPAVAVLSGMCDSLKSFAKSFILPSESSKLLQSLVREYCEQVRLHKSLIEPLFYTCWMHRALKEATRLSAAKIEKGHYVNLLRLCIENRQVAGLAQLFS